MPLSLITGCAQAAENTSIIDPAQTKNILFIRSLRNPVFRSPTFQRRSTAAAGEPKPTSFNTCAQTDPNGPLKKEYC